MSTTLIVNQQPFEYPDPGESPGWGQPASDWAGEVTLVLNDLLGPNDITQTTFAIQNNQSISNVVGLVFNTGQVRSSTIDYTIYRVSSTTTSGSVEAGTIRIVYDNNAATGSKWIMGVYDRVGDAGVVFSITDAGQIQYTSTDIGSISYSGVMHFRAKSLGQ